MDAPGLYLSVPFCTGKCTFCNFASDAYPAEHMDGYVDRLCTEIANSRRFSAEHGLALPEMVDSVFFGGGTPTLLQAAHILRIFDGLREQFAFVRSAEVTMEAAPSQIPDAVLQTLLACGVNRMSLGVQSFVDAESRAVGRTHAGASCRAEIDRLRSAGMANLSIDLIAGLPHQTAASWAESLHEAIGSGVDHVSVYMLEVDEDSRLGRELIGPGVRYGAAATPGESLVADLYAEACETLEAAGLRQYEISNFARPGFESRHNLKYWTRKPYLGFGLDAHSMLFDPQGQAVRFANGDVLADYMAGHASCDLERVDPLAAWEETIFLGLRLVEGVSIASLRQQFSAAWIAQLLGTSRELARAGLMQVSADRITLTQQGRIVSSSVFGELLANEAVAV